MSNNLREKIRSILIASEDCVSKVLSTDCSSYSHCSYCITNQISILIIKHIQAEREKIVNEQKETTNPTDTEYGYKQGAFDSTKLLRDNLCKELGEEGKTLSEEKQKETVCLVCYQRAMLYQEPATGLKPICLFPEHIVLLKEKCTVHTWGSGEITIELLSWLDGLTEKSWIREVADED